MFEETDPIVQNNEQLQQHQNYNHHNKQEQSNATLTIAAIHMQNSQPRIAIENPSGGIDFYDLGNSNDFNNENDPIGMFILLIY